MSVSHLSKDLSVCEAACRSAPDCAGFTFHGQGGGGLVYSSPCVLVTSCRVEDSRWCRDCVSLIMGGCRHEEEVRMTSQRRMWVDEDTDEESEDDNSEEFTDLEDEDLICSKYVEPPKHKVLPQAVVIGSRKGGTRKVSGTRIF